MTIDKDPSQKIENQLPLGLPKVTNETLDAIGDAMGEVGPGAYMREVYSRLAAEQAPLTEEIENYISGMARDDDEARRLRDVFMLTYNFLEVQAKSNGVVESPQSDSEDTSAV